MARIQQTRNYNERPSNPQKKRKRLYQVQDMPKNLARRKSRYIYVFFSISIIVIILLLWLTL